MKKDSDCVECCGCKAGKKNCTCVCKCFGFFQYDEWNHNEDDIPGHFEHGSIKILYRDKVRVFYSTVTNAHNDGYKEFNENVFSNKRGFVYSYTGLRGDAKFLYKQIVKGEEKRVKLVKAPTPKD